MKKLIFTLCFLFAAVQFTEAQIHFGIKGGINYNSDSFREVSDDIINGSAESRTGFHAGVWLRFKLPMTGWYVRPELVYTSLKSNVDLITTPTSTEKVGYDFQKIDIPVLLGKKFFKVAYAHIGPSFQYLLDGDLDFDAVSDIKADGFTVGLQLGAGVELGKIGLDLRWERAFSDVESEIISSVGGANTTANFDTRINQIIIGLSYRF
ncbi:porin family protein [uncultured Tenacibaculum sp.]|uniref:porin family protein n=1 Tax=uncultured Tenacibaculum sp. TaxID=174713 RepID=UPI002610B741|nr:porin family protein [uncultured Tenacibaculum sp.]